MIMNLIIMLLIYLRVRFRMSDFCDVMDRIKNLILQCLINCQCMESISIIQISHLFQELWYLFLCAFWLKFLVHYSDCVAFNSHS